MKTGKRLALWLVTTAMPVVIAACYGVYYRYSQAGKVVDKATGTGIAGIEVTCLLDDGATHSVVHSVDDGAFSLDYDTPCATLKALDVDGAENGSYLPAEVDFVEGEEPIVVELEADPAAAACETGCEETEQ